MLLRLFRLFGFSTSQISIPRANVPLTSYTSNFTLTQSLCTGLAAGPVPELAGTANSLHTQLSLQRKMRKGEPDHSCQSCRGWDGPACRLTAALTALATGSESRAESRRKKRQVRHQHVRGPCEHCPVVDHLMATIFHSILPFAHFIPTRMYPHPKLLKVSTPAIVKRRWSSQASRHLKDLECLSLSGSRAQTAKTFQASGIPSLPRDLKSPQRSLQTSSSLTRKLSRPEQAPAPEPKISTLTVAAVHTLKPLHGPARGVGT
jgi:hypothetical protein